MTNFAPKSRVPIWDNGDAVMQQGFTNTKQSIRKDGMKHSHI